MYYLRAELKQVILCEFCIIFIVLLLKCSSAVADQKQKQPNDDISVLNELPDGESYELHDEGKRLKRSTSMDVEKKSKAKKKEGRRRLAVSSVERIVKEALNEALQPLSAALALVRLDANCNGVLRQLTTLEHLQSSLLTEYGELRAAVNEVGRHTLDLGRQVAGLDERLSSIDRNLPHRMDVQATRSDFRSQGADSRIRGSVSPLRGGSDFVHVTESLKDVMLAITSKITATERRLRDELKSVENHTTEAIRNAQGQLQKSLTKASNSSTYCPSSSSSGSSPFIPRPSTDRFQQFERYFRTPHNSLRQHDEGKLVYLPALDDRTQSSGRQERDDEPPLAAPSSAKASFAQSWSRPVTEIQNLNIGMISRLASEIASQMTHNKDPPRPPRDCLDVAASGTTHSGVFVISPAACNARFSVRVWCEMVSSGGGWTVLHRRGSTAGRALSPLIPPTDFFRDWAEYKWGFGDTKEDFWLGNEYIHQMTKSADYELRIELEDWGGEKRWASFEHFSLGSEETNYTLSIGDYTGNAGNSLKAHQGAPFSTLDRDNDWNPRGHCALTFHAGWWFTSCLESNLNGRYHQGRHKSYGSGVNWSAFKGLNYSLKRATMMIRPTGTPP